MLQEGGNERQPEISHSDKDFPKVMHALLEMASRYAVGGSGNMIHYPEPDEFEKIPKGFYAMSGVELPSNAGSDYVEPDEDDPYNFIEVVFGVQSR